MSNDLAAQLDLNLAWRRIKFDRSDRCFASHPYLIGLVELDLQDWLSQINHRIIRGYVPSPSLTLNVPKGGWQVRPGAYIRLDDEVVLTALIGSFLENISQTIRWSQGNPDIAYQLPNRFDIVEWIRHGFFVWREWREKSIELLRHGAEFVLFSDISAFYENIDLHRLASDLRRININHETGDLLSDLLNLWAQPRGKGIPQGYFASDMLAKIYLEPVDMELRNEGFEHLRYVDDIRIFCRSYNQAKKSLLRLTELLRNRGLNIQAAKTEILPADQALHKIDGITPVIQAIQVNLQREIREGYDHDSYATLADLERLAVSRPERPPVEVLERTFLDHFINGSEQGFDKTLFHFILNRLGAVGSAIAREYCISLLARRPEETEHILRYLARIGLNEYNQDRIINHLNLPDTIYEYQVFQIIRHFYDKNLYPGSILQYCRRVGRENILPVWVKTYAIAILGNAGSQTDLEQLEAMYPECADEFQRASIICSCYRMEQGRRNAFFGRARRDGWLEEKAVQWARNRN